jgi:hypothetical protein
MAPELTAHQQTDARQRFEREEVKQGVKWADVQSMEKGFTAEDWQKIYNYQQTHPETNQPAAAPTDAKPPSGPAVLTLGQGDASPGTTAKTPDGKGGVDANFDAWVKQQHEDKNFPKSAHDILKSMTDSGKKPTSEQIDDVYKITGDEKFRKIDDFVDKHKGELILPEQQLAELAKTNPEQLTRENIERLYKDNGKSPPDVANDGKSVTSVQVAGIKGPVNVTKEELLEYEKMQDLQKQYETAMRSGNATLSQHLNTELSAATRQFFADAGQHNSPQIGGPSPEYFHEEQRRLQQLDQDRRQLEAQMSHQPGRTAELPKDQAEAMKHGAQGVGADGNPTPQFCRELKQLQETNPALYQAELQGATQQLMNLGVIPKVSYKYQDSKENVARVAGISADDAHPGFLIAVGETNHPGESAATFIYRDNTYWGAYYKDSHDRNKGFVQLKDDPDPIFPRTFLRNVEAYSLERKHVLYTDDKGFPLPNQ